MAWFDLGLDRVLRWIDEEWGDRMAARTIRKLRVRLAAEKKRADQLDAQLGQVRAELRACKRGIAGVAEAKPE